VYFQAIDDKKRCVGIYTSGELIFDLARIPTTFDGMRTWKCSGTTTDHDVDYGWLFCDGSTLAEVCPAEIVPEFESAASKMRAYRRSFEIAKINFNEHCFFDLVPHDFLVRFLDLKNRITQHVFENHPKPKNYDHLRDAHKLLHKINYQPLEINTEDCRSLFFKSVHRNLANKIIKGPRTINYNLFGTVTGRLSTYSDSFPILTMHKELRALLKPKNDLFLSLDYNGAELRTALALSGERQPEYDIHEWNMENIFNPGEVSDRSTAKTLFFSWLYNPESTIIKNDIYKREDIIKEHYDGEHIATPFGRKIKVDKRRAFNYIIQSTTADLVIDRAIEIDAYLKDHKSFISHIVHDEIVVDLAAEERYLAPILKEMFSNSKLGKFAVNLNAGKNYYNLEKLNL
jgi:hypothetical protein